MNKSVRAIKAVCVILALLLVVVSICIIIANSQNDLSEPNEILSNWMDMINDDAFVRSIAIPGSHDAGTYGMSYLAETQYRDIAEQLACGTRYFDIRVSLDNGNLRIYHGPFKGVNLDEVLSAFTTFLSKHPTEMLILDFQHFENSAENPTLEKIGKAIPSSNIIKNDTGKSDFEFINNLTLGQCRGKALIFWGRDISKYSADFLFQRNNDEGTRANSVLHSYYDGNLNKRTSSDYIAQGLPHYIELYKQHSSGLFVLQGQLTDGLFIFGPHFREATHTKNMNNFVTSLEKSGDLDLINIVMRDYVSAEKNMLTIKLNLNKNNVKESSLVEFKEKIK